MRRAIAHPTTQIRKLLLFALATAFVFLVAPAPAAAQEDVPEGVAEPPDPADVEHRDLLVTDASGKALDSGRGETIFGVELEGEDECPGDSAHDQYRVDSYMVPIDDDPTQVLYTSFGPTPLRFRSYDGFQMGLYKLDNDPLTAEFTAQANEPGGPGPIPMIPDFHFGSYVPTPGIEGYDGGLPSGSYRIGLACTYAGRITNLWETTIEISQDPADEPVGIRWTVTGPQPHELESAASGSSRAVVFGLLGLAAALGAVALFFHRSARRSSDESAAERSEETVA